MSEKLCSVCAYAETARAELEAFLQTLAAAPPRGISPQRMVLILDHLAAAYLRFEDNRDLGLAPENWKCPEAKCYLPAQLIEKWGNVDRERLAELAGQYIHNPADCRTYAAVVERLVAEIMHMRRKQILAQEYPDDQFA